MTFHNIIRSSVGADLSAPSRWISQYLDEKVKKHNLSILVIFNENRYRINN